MAPPAAERPSWRTALQEYVIFEPVFSSHSRLRLKRKVLWLVYSPPSTPTQELNVPFLKISAPEIVSGMSGESEAKLRDLFADAEVSLCPNMQLATHHPEFSYMFHPLFLGFLVGADKRPLYHLHRRD